MMKLDLALFVSYGGARFNLWTGRARSVQVGTGEHGFDRVTFTLPLRLYNQFRIYDSGVFFVRLGTGASALFEGRLEDPQIVEDGIQCTAFGHWRAFSDLDKAYTSLWSKTTTEGFEPRVEDLVAGYNPKAKRYKFDTQNRLYITPEKNAIFTSGVHTGGLLHTIPDQSLRQITGIQFDYHVLLPVDWNARLDTRTSADVIVVAAAWQVVGTGALLTGSVHLTLTTADRIEFLIFNNTGAPATIVAETDDLYLKITNLRFVTSITNRVNTTVAAGIAAGTRTVTPASMARIYVGQRLFIDSGAAVSESVLVTAATSTTFTAVFANAHGAAFTVQAHVVYADEIAGHLVSVTNSLNSGQISSSTALIASPGMDLLDEVYEDQTPADILTYLAELGDVASPPNRWEVGVLEGERLYFRIKGSAAQSWYVDATEVPNLQRTLTTLFNSIYADYEEAGGRTLRTAASTNTDSVTRYGITRRTSVKAATTLLAEAQFIRDVALHDQKDITPRAALTVTKVYTAAGAPAPLWMVRSGDQVTIRNLPPSLSTNIDRIRTFYVAETTYHVDNRTLDLVPEMPQPTLPWLLARQAKGFSV